MNAPELLPILRYPDPRLNTVAKPVGDVDDRVRALADRMLATMYDAHGIGLAATQVAPDAMIPANLLGLFAYIIGMVMGSLAPAIVAHKGHSIQHALTHHAHPGAAGSGAKGH